ncbi:hypothetical protein GCM10025867_06920 [Frondihabitans sucicola]|uniref:Gamma-glutamyl-gamma-aminobutyrate hydrolase family protein n=1 Tax=Frondihabitans sucicola TaxID=1268041 RepID=A0ABM8GJB4_9MICO|nr:gamma-glutamyl-gamma-aminobutyrate hydrolase family protein [Frondihabitans sucicola]BDZ48451.1 hypothetical protein GCM10025867_06920 [Frondihabitans sucicola]
MPEATRARLLVVDVSDRERADPAYGAELRELSANIRSAAGQAGFDVVRVASDTGELAEASQGADVILLTGGEDVDPALYGGDADYPGREEVFPEADLPQAALVREAVSTGIPLIGICRGMQLVNVALGGDLVQHLHDGGHVSAEPGMVTHGVAVDPGSRLAAALGATTLDVQSAHHQAVGRPGEGLRIVARADDGTPEAIEHASAPLWAVQWHPEDAGSSGSVLSDLLAAARDALRS